MIEPEDEEDKDDMTSTTNMMIYAVIAIAFACLVAFISSGCVLNNRCSMTNYKTTAETEGKVTITVEDTHSVDGDKEADANAAVSTSSGDATASKEKEEKPEEGATKSNTEMDGKTITENTAPVKEDEKK